MTRSSFLATFLLIALIIILVTPLCGMLFNCGCSWPWSGLDQNCNFHQTDARHRCPWCNSEIAAWISIGSSLLLGIATTFLMINNSHHTSVPDGMILGTIFGLSVFIVSSLIFAVISAYIQHYPLGILSSIGNR